MTPERYSNQSGAVGGAIWGCRLGGLGLRGFERSQWMGTSCNFSSSPLSPSPDPTSVGIVLKFQIFIFFSPKLGVFTQIFQFFFNFLEFLYNSYSMGCERGLRGLPRVQVLVHRSDSPKRCPQLSLIDLSQFGGSLTL